VEQVSWLDAKEFCRKLSQKTGKTYSLPSESQWEYACRAGVSTLFAYGDIITTDVANCNVNRSYGKVGEFSHRKETTFVKKFLPNAFGVFDMHGNVWEWCEDIWHESYKSAPVDGNSWDKRNNNNSQNPRLLRGGSWESKSNDCRSASRNWVSGDYRGNIVGFRIVCNQEL
jgi:eukaryotic-like serine/threonine-protein kinase